MLISFHITGISLAMNCDFQRVFLVTAHVSITHEVENILELPTTSWSWEIQLDLGFLLQCQSLDGNEAVRRRSDLVLICNTKFSLTCYFLCLRLPPTNLPHVSEQDNTG